MKIGLCDLHAVCLFVILIKFDMYIMAPEPISTAYFINPSPQSVGLYVYLLSLLENGAIKIPLSLLGNGSNKSYSGNNYDCNNRIIFEPVVLYAVRIVSWKQEIILPRTSCLASFYHLFSKHASERGCF
jgi:hypothetical protein